MVVQDAEKIRDVHLYLDMFVQYIRKYQWFKYTLPDGLLSLTVLKFEKFWIHVEFNNSHSWPIYQFWDSFFQLLAKWFYLYALSFYNKSIMEFIFL